MLHATAGRAQSADSHKGHDAAASKQVPANAGSMSRIPGNQARLRISAIGSAAQRQSRMPMLQRKCACGGTCADCGRTDTPQLKAAISEPGDAFEQEADRVADQVMRMAAPAGQARAEDGAGSQARANNAESPTGIPPAVGAVLRSAGQPLDSETRAFMEPRFGQVFDSVRVHTDTAAAASARAVNALAYTVGKDIVFGTGRYHPGGYDGRRLIAHELAHVVQQGGTAPPGVRFSSLAIPPSEDRLEANADRPANAVWRNAGVLSSSPIAIQRECTPGRQGIGATATTACSREGERFIAGANPKCPKLKFCTDTDELLPGQDTLVDCMVRTASGAATVELHGNASTEGPSADYNWNLSCYRAAAAARILSDKGLSGTAKLIAHGATDRYGDPVENRNAVMVLAAPPPKKEEPPREEPAPPPVEQRRHACVVSETIPKITTATVPFDDKVLMQTECEIQWRSDPASNCDCSCGEYRQYVKGHVIRDGQKIDMTLCDGAHLQEDVYQEDGDVTGNACYGHRDRAATKSDVFDQADRNSGCHYLGKDEPSVPGHTGTMIDVDFKFKGQTYDKCLDTFGPIHEWSFTFKGPLPAPP